MLFQKAKQHFTNYKVFNISKAFKRSSKLVWNW